MKVIKRIIKIVIILMITLFIARTAITHLYPFQYREIINREAEKYGLSPYFVAAVIKTESGFDTDAKSIRDAKGLMQLTEETGQDVAQKMGIKNYNSSMLHDPETNIAMGCWYLDDLMKEFDGNTALVLAAYNAGRGNVAKWLKDNRYSKNGEDLHYIPFGETDKYLKKVKTNYNIYKFIYGKH